MQFTACLFSPPPFLPAQSAPLPISQAPPSEESGTVTYESVPDRACWGILFVVAGRVFDLPASLAPTVSVFFGRGCFSATLKPTPGPKQVSMHTATCRWLSSRPFPPLPFGAEAFGTCRSFFGQKTPEKRLSVRLGEIPARGVQFQSRWPKRPWSRKKTPWRARQKRFPLPSFAMWP